MSDDYFDKLIRFLGNLLGDTLREQEGKQIFELIEKVRRLSVAYHGHDDVDAGGNHDYDEFLENDYRLSINWH